MAKVTPARAFPIVAPDQTTEARELANLINAHEFGLKPDQVAEQWRDYSRDFGREWVEPTPASMARFVGWLVRAIANASN